MPVRFVTSAAPAALLFALSACVSPTAPIGLASPSGMFYIKEGTFGPATAEHAVLADRYWNKVQECVGKRATAHDIQVVLMAGEKPGAFPGGRPAFTVPGCGSGGMVGGCLINHSAMYVLGDVIAHPDWAESWKHEQTHLLLWLATGNDGMNDPDHGKSPPQGVWLCQVG